MSAARVVLLQADEPRGKQGDAAPLTLKVQDSFRAHSAVYSSAFSSDGRLFGHCGSSLALRLRFVQGGKTKECGALLLPGLPRPRTYDDLHSRDANGMVNCVRFGVVAGRERIIVSGQDGFVRILELPKPISDARFKASQPVNIFPEAVCRALRDGSNPNLPFMETGPELTHSMQEVIEERLDHDDDDSLIPEDSCSPTVAFGPFPHAVNCCDASPDGRWLALAIDSLSVLLLPEALDYCHLAALRLRLDTNENDAPVGGLPVFGRAPGCQYVAWSRDSRFLAASSDTHRCVAVWRVSVADADMAPALVAADLTQALSRDGCDEVNKTLLDALSGVGCCPFYTRTYGDEDEGELLRAETLRSLRSETWGTVARSFWRRVDVQPVAQFRDHPSPCLALAWHPCEPSLLLYALESSSVTCVDVRRPDLARHVLGLCGKNGFDATTVFDTQAPGSQPATSLMFVDRWGRLDVSSSRRITGACVVSGRFAVSTAEAVHLLPVVTWSRATHRLWPRRFKAVVRLLLVNGRFGPARRRDVEQEGLLLHDLPAGALDIIIEKAARARHEWVF